MAECTAEQFLDIQNFAYPELFSAEDFAWVSLDRLSSFLDSFSHQGIACPIPEGVYLENPETISIGEGTILEPGAFLRGPLVIGKNCSIRHGAYLRGYIVTGDHCVIGHATEVKHAIFLDHAQAAHFAYVGDSILGNDVNLGAGVKCANLRLDHSPIVIHGLPQGDAPTGRRKLGAIIGDGAQIGCNAVLSPGTLIGKKAICYPCTHVRGYVPPEARVKGAIETMKLTKGTL